MSRMENRRKGDAPSSPLSRRLEEPRPPGQGRRFAQSTDSNVNLIRGTTPADTPHGTADRSGNRGEPR